MKFTIENSSGEYTVREYSRMWKFSATGKKSSLKSYVEGFATRGHEKISVKSIVDNMIQSAVEKIHDINDDWENCFNKAAHEAVLKIEAIQTPITVAQMVDISEISMWSQHTILRAFESDEQKIHHFPAIYPDAEKKHFIVEVLKIWAEFMLEIYRKQSTNFRRMYQNKNIHNILEALTHLK